MCTPGILIGTIPTLIGMGAQAAGPVAAASLAISAAGVAISAAGAVKQADYQSDVMKRNAKRAAEDRKHSLERGREEESNLRMRALQLAGKITAGEAAGGLIVSEDTPDSLLEDVYYMTELDAQIIRKNAERDAYAYADQAAGYMAQSSMFQQQGTYNAGSSILAGAATMADQWYRYNRPFTPSTERTAAGAGIKT